MEAVLQEQLVDRFEFLRTTCSGLDVGDGWYQLLWEMSEEIEAILLRSPTPPVLHMNQIKEKYGELSVLYDISWSTDASLSHGVKNKACDDTEGRRELAQRIDEVITKYEEKSSSVCDVCGAPNSSLRTDVGYLITLCDQHYLEEKRRRGAPSGSQG